MNPAPFTAQELGNCFGAGISPKDPKSNPISASAHQPWQQGATVLSAGIQQPQLLLVPLL